MFNIRQTATVITGTVLAAGLSLGLATPASASAAHKAAASAGCSASAAPASNKFNRTPDGESWTVAFDRCNYEGKAMGSTSTPYDDNAYWAAEKRPDLFWGAVNTYGYKVAPYGAWNIEIDAKKAGYSITNTPQVGDIAAWKPNAMMGQTPDGYNWYQASSGGHVSYVEAVNADGTITVSETGHGTDDYGHTFDLRYTKATFFIHR
ncbi:MAG TPA: CHAP domain-containing protein [Mycobacteriales bacterium]|nr:CHAP domain-containing protein [Mycobacteriales bacterium]